MCFPNPWGMGNYDVIPALARFFRKDSVLLNFANNINASDVTNDSIDFSDPIK